MFLSIKYFKNYSFNNSKKIFNNFIFKIKMERNYGTNSRMINIKSMYNYEHYTPVLKHQIELTDKEKEIFGIIKEILMKNNKKTVCRVAGGWVRDKVNNKI